MYVHIYCSDVMSSVTHQQINTVVTVQCHVRIYSSTSCMVSVTVQTQQNCMT